MKKLKILIVVLLSIVTTTNAQLKSQIKNLEKQDSALYIKENGLMYRVDKKTITVKLKEGKNLDTRGGKILRKNILGYIDIEIPNGEDVLEFASILDDTGDFEVVELNSWGECNDITVNDTYVGSQWYLDRIGIFDA